MLENSYLQRKDNTSTPNKAQKYNCQNKAIFSKSQICYTPLNIDLIIIKKT